MLALLCGAAVLIPLTVQAACSPNIAPPGTTVTCSGADTTGISGGQANVIVQFTGGPASINTTGVSAIVVGNSGQINLTNAAVTSDTTTIQTASGHVTVSANSALVSTTGIAILGTSNTGTFRVNANGVITGTGGTAIRFGNNQGTLTYNPATATITGNVYAGTGLLDTFNLTSNTATTFNSSLIDTQYVGFERFFKLGAGTITLTGANTKSWTVSDGVLQGDTSSLQGNIVNNAGLVFDQAGNGTYAGNISGTGTLTKSGAGSVVLSGTNNYAGATTITGGALSIGALANLGAGALVLDGGGLRVTSALTLGHLVTLGAGGGAVDTAGNTVTLSGVISGAGALTKTGAGTLVLSGANTYSGGTVISDGTLEGDLATIQGDITNNAALVLNQTTDTIYAGVISGNGTMRKTGAGDLRLAGNNSFSGNTAIEEGRLFVDGAIGGTITVAAGAALGGAGTTGHVVNNGILALDGANAVLNVDGNLTFNNGAIYRIEADETGQSGRVVATGDIVLNGGAVDMLAGNGTYNVAQSYTILQGHSVAGAFDGVTSDLAFLTPELTYHPDRVALTLARNDIRFEDVTKIFEGQGPLAGAVESLGPGNALYDAFLQLSAAAVPDALAGLSGQHANNAVTGMKAAGFAVQNVVAGRYQKLSMPQDTASIHRMALRPAATNAAPQLDASHNLDAAQLATLEPALGVLASRLAAAPTGWVEIFGAYGRHDGLNGISSTTTKGSGVIFGLDIPVNDYFVAGIYGGIERADGETAALGSRNDTDAYHGGVYGSLFPDENWRISGSVGASRYDMETQRHIRFPGFDETARGTTDGYALSSQLEAGYTLGGGGIAVEPYVGLHHVYTSVDGYTEQDAGAANLAVAGVDAHVWGHTLGMNVAKSFDQGERRPPVQVRVNLGWVHNYGDLAPTSTSTFASQPSVFETSGADLYKNALKGGLDVVLPLNEEASLYGAYEGVLAPESHHQLLKLGIKLRF